MFYNVDINDISNQQPLLRSDLDGRTSGRAGRSPTQGPPSEDDENICISCFDCIVNLLLAICK